MVGAILLSLALPSPARSGAPMLVLNPISGPSGSTVTAVATNFNPDSALFLQWDDGTSLGAGTTNAAGSAMMTFVVPAGAAPLPHLVTMCTDNPSSSLPCDPPMASYPFAVTASTPTPEPTPTTAPTPTPTATPTPSPAPSPTPTIPLPTFPLGGETPTPEPPPLIAVTPAPTPPNQLADDVGEFPDLWIKGIEVTQGIQDLQNRMPLVENRRTYARVYVGVIGQPEWAPTEGALEARRNGQQIGWIWSENGPITARLGAGSRVETDDSLNFRLPAGWLHGEVTLRAFVYSFSVATVFEKEAEWQNNLAGVSVEFHPANPLTVHLAPLHLHRSFHPDDVERTYDGELNADFIGPGGSATMRTVHGLYRFHPLAQVNVDAFTAAVTPIGHGADHEFDLGWCRTTLIEAQAGNVVDLADWEPLREDPDSLNPVVGPSYDADIAETVTLAILDRRIEVDHWYLNEDGTATVYGNLTDSSGPSPLPGTPVLVGGCHQDPQVSQEANQTLSLFRVYYDWDDEEDLFVGMVHPSLATHFAGLSTGGTDSVWVRMRDTFSGSSPWDHSAAGVLAHEAAHAAGLNHVSCLDDDGDGVPDELRGGAVDPSHPNALTFPSCSLADVDPDGYYGFDVYWSLFGLDGPTAISNNPGQAAPNAAWPMLSYKNPGWADPYHYCRLLDFYGVPCDPTDLGIPWSEPDAPAGGPLTAPLDPTHDQLPPGSSGLIGLRGSFDPEVGSGSLEGAYVVTEPTPTAMRRYAGQYVIADARHFVVVLDAAGVELARVPIRQHDHTHLDKDSVDFEILVPVFPQAHVYQLQSTDLAFVRLAVSPNEPAVTWTAIAMAESGGRTNVHLEWRVEDLDADPLEYTLLYAPDGEHWQVVAAGLTEPSHAVFLDTLPGGESPMFQVIAFDGTRAGSATSVPLEPEEANPNVKPGLVVKVDPNSTYPLGMPVLLAADAFDPEDRTMPGEAIRWSSSIDGDLGTGSELLVEDLSAGAHTLTASVTDSDGLTATASFELTVDPDVVQPQPDPDLEADIDAIFAALAAGEDPSDAISRGPDQLLIAVALLVFGAVVIGGTLLIWVRRGRASPAEGAP
jgi:hypothetical protein